MLLSESQTGKGIFFAPLSLNSGVDLLLKSFSDLVFMWFSPNVTVCVFLSPPGGACARRWPQGFEVPSPAAADLLPAMTASCGLPETGTQDCQSLLAVML